MERGRRGWIALLQLLLSPAVGGTLLPFLHPCPVDSPWVAQEQSIDHSGHHQGGGGHDAGQPCTCPGKGSVPSLAAAPTAAIVAIVYPAPRHEPWAVVEHPAAGVVVDLLPEATAPPLA